MTALSAVPAARLAGEEHCQHLTAQESKMKFRSAVVSQSLTRRPAQWPPQHATWALRVTQAQPGTRSKSDEEQPSPPGGEKHTRHNAQLRGRLFIPGGKAT